VSEQAFLWLFGTLITLNTLVLAAIAGRLWDHVEKCRDVHGRLSRAESQIENVEKDIVGMRLWKHTVADPYIPRAIEEHERRINRLDQKMDER
jgi:hypothetical protein